MAPGTEVVSYMICTSFYGNSTLDNLGYADRDLDNNGIPELIIGWIEEGTNKSETPVDLYTWKNGKIYHLISDGKREDFIICSNNTIIHSGSAGAAYSSFFKYKLKAGATSLTAIEVVFSEPNDNWNMIYWYHGKEGSYNPTTYKYNRSKLTKISESKARKTNTSWPKASKLSGTPFRKYTM